MNAVGLLLALGITAQADAAPSHLAYGAAYAQQAHPGWGFAPVTFGPCAPCAPQSVPACDGAYWAYCSIPRNRNLHLWDTYCAETAPCPCCGYDLGGWMHRWFCRAGRYTAGHCCHCGPVADHVVLPDATEAPAHPDATAAGPWNHDDELPPAPTMDEDVPVADTMRGPSPSLLDLFFAPRDRGSEFEASSSEGETSAPAEFPALQREER